MVLRDIDVEAIRVPLERGMLRILRVRFGDAWGLYLSEYERVSAHLEVEAELQKLALDPRVARAAAEARRVLGVDRAIEVHASNETTACAYFSEGGPMLIGVHWSALARLDEPALVAVLGHELGHHLTYRLRGTDAATVRRILKDEQRSSMRDIATAACWAQELTADRFALLACQDLDAVVALFAHLYDPENKRNIRPDRFFKVARARAEKLLAGGERARGDTHPELSARVYAAWLFSQTETYHRLTGRGSGAMRIEDVDITLARLIGPPENVDDEGLPPDDPGLLEQLGDAVSKRGAALKEAVREQATTWLATAFRKGTSEPAVTTEKEPPATPTEKEPPSADEDEHTDEDLDEVEIDDLERRFRDLERQADKPR